MLLFENAYISLLFYFIISSLLAITLFILPLLLATSNISQEHEKVSAYECGFEPFSDVRDTFDIHFIVVAILFIIFDLELIFIFPWAISIANLTFFGFWSMSLFLILLTIGFVYEWSRGALIWPIFLKK